MLKQFVVSTLCVSVLAVSGCGFALRGTDKSLHVAPQHQSVQITTTGTSEATALKQPLIKHLQMRGVDYAPSANAIRLDNVHFRRYDVVGTLTEVRLVLLADVVYEFNGQKHSYPLQVERSYQYNEASVVAVDGQGDKAKTWLYDNLAERIAEQYRSLAKTTK